MGARLAPPDPTTNRSLPGSTMRSGSGRRQALERSCGGHYAARSAAKGPNAHLVSSTAPIRRFAASKRVQCPCGEHQARSARERASGRRIEDRRVDDRLVEAVAPGSGKVVIAEAGAIAHEPAEVRALVLGRLGEPVLGAIAVELE